MDYRAFTRNRIAYLCKTNKISMTKLSKELGLNKGYIQNIISGQSLPSIATLLKLCTYFNLSPMYFFDESVDNPQLLQKAIDELTKMKENDVLSLIYIINRFNEKG